jgi:hypothetical protein
MVPVTQRGELLVQTDNLLRTITLEGKPISAIRLVKVGQADVIFVNSSPAVSSVAVIQSSEAQGKTVNGVAVLDAHGLESLAPYPSTSSETADPTGGGQIPRGSAAREAGGGYPVLDVALAMS